MAHLTLRALGKRSSIQLPALGLGGAGVMCGGSGSAASAGGGRTVDERIAIGFKMPTDIEAQATLGQSWEHGVRYFVSTQPANIRYRQAQLPLVASSVMVTDAAASNIRAGHGPLVRPRAVRAPRRAVPLRHQAAQLFLPIDQGRAPAA